MTARVSVVIPCFDHGRFLRQAVDSVLQSTHENAEVVVVNDGSTDDSLAIARSYGSEVRVVDQPNRGLCAARNAGLAVASGELVNFLDADDRLDPEFLERMVDAAEREPDTAVFCGGWTLMDADDHPLGSGKVSFPDDIYRFLLGGNPMPCHAVVTRRAALGESPPFDESLLSLEDWDLWLRLAAAGHRFSAVPDANVYYRRYEGSMSRDIDGMLAAARQVYRRHRGKHWLARVRGMRAIRFGLYCENVLPKARRAGLRALLAELWRHPTLIESLPLHLIFAVCPPLRRFLGVSEQAFARDH